MSDSFFVESPNHYFGFSDCNGSLKFYVPKELLPHSNDNEFKVLKRYLKILKQYINTQNKEEKDYHINESTLDLFLGYLILFEDYKKYSLYQNIETSVNQKGKKINWGQTIKKTTPLVSEGALIYGSFRKERRHNNNEEEFYKLYLAALSHTLSLFVNVSEFYTLERDHTNAELRYIINKFKNEKYSDREQTIATALEFIYLQNSMSTTLTRKLNFECHTKFENIWEFLVEFILTPASINIPKGSYLNDENEKLGNGLALRPDHIIKNSNNELVVIDSKFYSVEEGSFPDTPDIVKQLLYRYVLQKDFPECFIKNVFLCPQNYENEKDYYHYCTHQANNDEFYTVEVWCFKVSFVIDCYFKKQTINNIFN